MLDAEYDPYNASDHANECYGLSPAKMTVVAVRVRHHRGPKLTGQVPGDLHHGGLVEHLHRRGAAAFAADPMWVAAYGFTTPA